jgi:hypothetical protein
MNEVIERKGSGIAVSQSSGRMAVSEVLGAVKLVQEVMQNIMKVDVHYGKIPGTPKPTLLKPGAELLCMAFRIAPSYRVEDLSTEDKSRYRVTCTGTHQTTGYALGDGMGTASSGEAKYKWRKSFKDEFEATLPHLRREHKGKDRDTGREYSVFQVRTEPDDLENTILKMANKRALVAMVLNVTAASDMFTQDLEDLEGAMREQVARGEHEAAEKEKPALPFYTDDVFKDCMVTWKKVIKKGTKDVAGVLATVATMYQLTEAQTEAIKAIPAELMKEAGQRQPEERTGPVIATEPFVKAQMEAAKNIDDLNVAADLINSISDAAAVQRLNEIYGARASQLN